MDYTIIDAPAFTLVGKALRVSTKDGENHVKIPAFWRESMGDGTLDSLHELQSKEGVFSGALLGVCKDFAGDWSEFTYVIATEPAPGAAAAGLDTTVVPAMSWAKFDANGSVPDMIGPLWENIMSDFLENSPYRHGPGPDIEVYPPGDPMGSNYQFSVWVPVVKK